jgi:hypothetical protein
MAVFIRNENMKPMGSISTPFLSYHNIKTNEADLYEDAFGLNSQFYDVINLLKQVKPVPGRRLTKQLIEKIRK